MLLEASGQFRFSQQKGTAFHHRTGGGAAPVKPQFLYKYFQTGVAISLRRDGIRHEDLKFT